MNSIRKPYRPPAVIQPVSPAVEGLRKKAFAIGYELKLKPAQVKDRAHAMFNEPVFDRLSADQLDHLARSLQTELDERKQRSRWTAELIDETARKAAAAAIPAKRSGLRDLNSTIIETYEPAFEGGGPSRFAISIERMDKGRDVRTGKPVDSKPLYETAGADDPIMNHPLVKHVRARFPNAQVVKNISSKRVA